MVTKRITGPGLNLWFAEQIVKDQGPEKARENTAGAMRAAVEAVIARQATTPSEPKDTTKGQA